MLKKEKIFHNLFLAGLVVKGVDGLLELLGGTALLFIKSDYLIGIIQILFKHELVQDPTDFIANYLIQASQHLSSSVLLFAAIYLIIHGLIKIGLFTGLWLKRLWTYPVAGIVLGLFVFYQTARLFNNFSLILLILTVIDTLIIFLLRFEYNRLKINHKKII